MNILENIKATDELYTKEVRHLYIPAYEFMHFGDYIIRVRGNYTLDDVLQNEGDSYEFSNRVTNHKKRKQNARVVLDMIRDYLNLLRGFFKESEINFHRNMDVLKPKFMDEIKIHIHKSDEYSESVREMIRGENDKVRWISSNDFLYDVMMNGSITTF